MGLYCGMLVFGKVVALFTHFLEFLLVIVAGDSIVQ